MTTLHTQNGTGGALAPLYYPGGLTDEQIKRFNGDPIYNQIVYSTFYFSNTHAPMIDLQIEAEVKEIRAINEQMQVLEDEIAAKKARLRVLLTARGSNYEDSDGYARLVKDSVRTSYDTRALDELILKNRWFSRLRKFRKEFTVRGGVQVK